jgi:hypothetical protein
MRQIIAGQIAMTAKPEELLTEILVRFYLRLRCLRCGSYQACEHRSRRDDVQLILRSKGDAI